MEDVQACFAAEWDKADGEGNYSYHETVESEATAASGEPPILHDRKPQRPSGSGFVGGLADGQYGGKRAASGGRGGYHRCPILHRQQAWESQGVCLAISEGIGGSRTRTCIGSWTWCLTRTRSRIRKDHGQENLALLRRLAVSVLKNAKSCPGSIRTKQLQAILDDEVLHDMLSIFSGG